MRGGVAGAGGPDEDDRKESVALVANLVASLPDLITEYEEISRKWFI